MIEPFHQKCCLKKQRYNFNPDFNRGEMARHSRVSGALRKRHQG